MPQPQPAGVPTDWLRFFMVSTQGSLAVLCKRGYDDAMTHPISSLPSPYQQIGGAPAVEALVNRFYDLVEFEPDAAPLRVLHASGHGFSHARQAQFLFLTGFLGGPHLYHEQNGHADVLQMHAHLNIQAPARDAWLSCMRKAMQLEGLPEDVANRLMVSFTRIADRILSHAPPTES